MPNDERDHPANAAANHDEAVASQLEHWLAGSSDLATTPSELAELSDVLTQLSRFEQYLTQEPTPTSTIGGSDTGRETGDYLPGPSRVTTVLPVGDRIGKYEIVRKLGRGGQGEAYLAFDPDLHRHVVVKRYHAAIGDDVQSALLSEGRALARVRSPYLAQCYGVEQHEDGPYLVMEYVPGRSLAGVLATGRPPRAWALRLVRQLAEGLAAVHACGLLHRDVKPGNVVVGDDTIPRLVDFGLATHLASEELRKVSGTLAYLAPEQARGEMERIDPRTDLFGLGAVLFEMLTGRPPYQAATRNALLEAAQRGDVPSPSQFEPDLPEPFEALCRKCLAKEPTQRFASANELIQAIDRIDLQPMAPQPPPQRQRWPVVAACAAGLLLTIGIGLYWLYFRPEPVPAPPAVSQTENMVDGRTKTATTGERPLRKDFGVKVSLLDRPVDPTGKWVLHEDDQISFTIEVEKDAYVGVWYVDHEGRALQLFPNSLDSEQFLKAGQPKTLPGDRKYAVRVTAQEGPEHVRVLATTQPWSPLIGERAGPDGVYNAFTSTQKQKLWSDAVRGLELVPKTSSDAAQIAEVVIPLEVTPK